MASSTLAKGLTADECIPSFLWLCKSFVSQAHGLPVTAQMHSFGFSSPGDAFAPERMQYSGSTQAGQVYGQPFAAKWDKHAAHKPLHALKEALSPPHVNRSKKQSSSCYNQAEAKDAH